MATDFWKGKAGTLLGQLLGLDVEEGASSPVRKPSSRDEQKWYDGSEVKSLTLEQVLKEEAANGPGGNKVYTVTLDEFAAAVGDKWSRLKGKVDLIADGVARRHVGKGILCTNLADGSFMVTVLGKGSAEGRRRVVGLADDLGHRLVGSLFDGKREAKVRITEADPAELLDADGNIKADVWARLVQAPEVEVPADARRHVHEQRENPKPFVESAPPATHPSEAPVAGVPPRVDTQPLSRKEAAPAPTNRVPAPKDAARPGGGGGIPLRPAAPAQTPVEEDPQWSGAGVRHDAPEVGRSSTRRETTPRLVSLGTAAPDGDDPEWTETEAHWTEQKVGRSSTRREAETTLVTMETTAGDAGDPDWGRSEARRSDRDVGHSSTRAEKEAAFVPLDHVPLTRGDPKWKDLDGREAPPSARARLVAIDRPPPHHAAKEGERKIPVVFRPVWSAASQSRNAHVCMAAGGGGDVILQDFELVLAAMGGLSETVSAKEKKGTLILPLHFATLCGGDARIGLAAVENFARFVGVRNLMIEVFAIPRSATADGVNAAFAPIRPLCRGILARTDLFSPQFESLIPCDPAAIGVDLEALPDPERTEARIRPALAAFNAGAWGTPGYLWGVRSYWEVAAAVEQNFVLLSGARVMPDVPVPGAPLPLTQAEIRIKLVSA